MLTLTVGGSSMLLFVYGTFCRGLSRNTVLKDSGYMGIVLIAAVN
jgi:hypothetical protein